MPARLRLDALSLHDPRETTERIVRFIKTYADRAGAKHLVVGMSGGVDSSVAAVLCSMAVGGPKTLGFFLSESDTGNRNSLQDAQEVARRHRVRFKLLDLTPLVKAASDLVHDSSRADRIPSGNIKARLRATVLYYMANTNQALVVGTGDKSEIMLGYFTKYGDGACDIQPLADMYKTTVRELARHLKLPARIYSKPSSPELWPGQTAESELGIEYQRLDMVLWELERWIPATEISADLSIPLRTVQAIRRRWLSAEHKRRPPLAMKLGFRTTGQDLRIPYTL